MEIEEKYPEEYKKILSGNLRFAFNSLSNEIQEETLKQMKYYGN